MIHTRVVCYTFMHSSYAKIEGINRPCTSARKAASITSHIKDKLMTTAIDNAIALQANLSSEQAAAKAARGKANETEFLQYCLTILGGVMEKPTAAQKKVIKQRFIDAGRSERNTVTIMTVCFHREVAKLVKDCEDVQAVANALAAAGLKTVSALKRHIAEPRDKVAALLEEVLVKLEPEQQEEFKEAYLAAIGE